MDKLEFMVKQISKTNKKNRENYVITRIVHLLNDLEIKFITQQYVIRPNNKRALMDMYFPQINFFIEINEEHHEKQIDQDKIRNLDIVNAINCEPEEIIDVTKPVNDIHKQIDGVVSKIKEKINKLKGEKKFIPWDLDNEFNPDTYIEKGYIDVEDKVSFYKISDIIKCFGENKSIQQGGVKHPKEKDVLLWWPKLYLNDIRPENIEWLNEISDDENTITEINKNPERAQAHIELVKKEKEHIRIVFAKIKDALGDNMYRFKGKYELNINQSNFKNGLIWKRISSRVKTYNYK
ncbi:MAG TPA: hypothetical protein PKY81_07375 [bacterium]|nr:hypothetical protein [bacterium]